MENKTLNYRLRRNHGKQLAPEVSLKFCGALGVTASNIVFAPLDLTDGVSSLLYSRMPDLQRAIIKDPTDEALRLYLYSDKKDLLEHSLRFVQNAVEDRKVLLLHEASQYTGAIVTTLFRALDHAFEICKYEGQDLEISDETCSAAITLEHFCDYSPTTSRNVYRLCVWCDRLRP